MVQDFGFKPGVATRAFHDDEYYVWDSAVIFAEGQYHLYCSRWPQKMGFGWNWVFNCEIIHAVSDVPEGPYRFSETVLPRRGRAFFDGMSTHNTCIRFWQGKYYLYYMGTTYGGNIPDTGTVDPLRALETWNRKRIGVAVADSPFGPFTRRDAPLLEPRDPSHWDCTITTNPTVAILPSGKTYMIYKSRSSCDSPMQLGAAVADRPDGPFTRLSEEPILRFGSGLQVEDPFLWYDARREKFCLLAKDCGTGDSGGIFGPWGCGFYAESDDCLHFTPAPHPVVYTREVHWADGRTTVQGNLERPSLLFDENGCPTHLFCATGEAERPFDFSKATSVACIRLEKE